MHTAAPTGTAEPGRWATFAALRHHNYRLFWLGQAVFVAGQTMEWVALGWLVYDLTGSTFTLGLTGLAQAGPRIVLSMLGGTVADRVNRKRLVIITQLITSALYFTLGALVLLGVVQVWQVMLVALLLGAVRAFDGPSRQALVPHLVAKADIPSAVALGNLAWEVPRTVGPAAAGVLISQLGIGQAFLSASFALLGAASLFGSIRADLPLPQRTGRSMLHNMIDGLAYVRHHEVFLALIGLVFFNSVFGMSYQLLMPVFARDILLVGSEGLGVLQSFNAVGGILGSLLAAFLAQRNRRGWQALGGAVVFGLAVVAFGLSTWYPLSLALTFVLGLSSALYMITVSTVLQIHLPDEFRGRVLGLWSLTWSLMPLGGTIGGTVATFVGTPFAVALGGLLVVAMAIVVAITNPHVRDLR